MLQYWQGALRDWTAPWELRFKLREPLASPCSSWRFAKQAALCQSAAPQQLLQC